MKGMIYDLYDPILHHPIRIHPRPSTTPRSHRSCRWPPWQPRSPAQAPAASSPPSKWARCAGRSWAKLRAKPWGKAPGKAAGKWENMGKHPQCSLRFFSDPPSFSIVNPEVSAKSFTGLETCSRHLYPSVIKDGWDIPM